MSDVPDELKYTAEHEWIRTSGDTGSTTLRAVVYVSLPAGGAAVQKGAAIGEIESTKSVSDVFAPLTGTVSARNEKLDEEPELINSDPYGAGWILEIDLADAADVDDLLDAAAYSSLAG